MSNTLYIIDGHSYIYASFYAVRDLTSPSGEPTNATYGFMGTLLKLLKSRRPDKLVVTMDSPGPTFRHEQFAEYKANRPAMPEELPRQIERIKQLAELLHIPVLAKESYEADDIIASLCREVDGTETEVFICSKDKDLEQLISPKVAMYDAKTDSVLDLEHLDRKKGLTPQQTADVLALTGDSSDNIPGVPGIGPKKATSLIQKYGSLDELLAHAEEVPGAMGRNLTENIETVQRARELVALRDDVDTSGALDGVSWRQAPEPELKDVLKELGFNRFISAIEELWPSSELEAVTRVEPQKSSGYVLVDSEQKFQEFYQN